MKHSPEYGAPGLLTTRRKEPNPMMAEHYRQLGEVLADAIPALQESIVITPPAPKYPMKELVVQPLTEAKGIVFCPPTMFPKKKKNWWRKILDHFGDIS